MFLERISLCASFGGQLLADLVGDLVAAGDGADPGRRPLQHRHVRRGSGALGHGGHERHRRGAAADDDDPLAGVVEVVGPELWLHDRAPVGVDAGENRLVAVVVVVVARAGVQEVAGEPARRGRAVGVLVLQGQRPPRLLGGPVGADDLGAEPDLLVDAVLGGGLAHVPQDRRPVGDRLRLAPRLERVAECEHVGVRPDAGVAEQVPGAADGVAGLEDRVAATGALGLQAVAGADPGEAGTDHDDVEVLRGGGGHASQSPRRA